MTKDYLKYEDVLLGKVTLPEGKTFLSSVDALNRMYPCHNCVGFWASVAVAGYERAVPLRGLPETEIG